MSKIIANLLCYLPSLIYDVFIKACIDILVKNKYLLRANYVIKQDTLVQC